jgi:hypothetical protein
MEQYFIGTYEPGVGSGSTDTVVLGDTVYTSGINSMDTSPSDAVETSVRTGHVSS